MKTPPASVLAFVIATIAAHADPEPRASDDSSQPPKKDEWTLTDERLQLLLESHKADHSPLTSLGFSLSNAKLQRELYQQFEKDCPDLLADALRSAGNMHNPKILPLRAKFSDSMLKTATMKKVAEQLKKHGYTIQYIGCEKFSIIKDTDPPTFFGITFISLNPRAEQAAAGDGDKPAN